MSQVVVITGAAGNVGQAVAQKFAQQGAQLALLDLNEAGITPIIENLPEGTQAKAFAINLLDSAAVEQCFNQVIDHFGRIDVLANIAGGFTMGPLTQDTPDKDWDFMMNLNARSVFYASRAAIPHMLNQEDGRIINVSARAALHGAARMGPYCASKAAIITLTETIAAENKYDNINVNCIMPGTVDTPQNRNDMPEADFDKWVPTDALADVVAFLASDAARCVTGAAIPVYGKS